MSADSTARRLLVVVALVLLAIAAAVFDNPSGSRRPTAPPSEDTQIKVGAQDLTPPSKEGLSSALPVASSVNAASSTWFCGGGSGAADSPLASVIQLTNRATKSRRAVIRPYGSKPAFEPKLITIAARSTVEISMSDVTTDVQALVTIEVAGGGVTVSQRIGTADAVTAAACATASSDSWYFASGTTEKGASEKLVLFNPFDNLATADVSFLTEDGLREPQSVHGIPVSPGGFTVVDVAKVENRRKDLASIVATRSGRVIVWRTQTFDGSGPALGAGFAPKGISVTLGSPAVLKSFTLPAAVNGDGVSSRITIANPGAADATVKLTISPDDPATNGQPPLMTLKVPAGMVKVLEAKDLQQVPGGVPFTVTGRVSGGPVVAELWLDGVDPAVGHGADASVGSPVAARQWVSMMGLTAPALDQLSVASTGKPASFTVTVIDGGTSTRLNAPKMAKQVHAKGRVSVDLTAIMTEHPGATVIVEASAPVVVSRLQAGTDQLGLLSTLGIPVAGGLVAPAS